EEALLAAVEAALRSNRSDRAPHTSIGVTPADLKALPAKASIGRCAPRRGVLSWRCRLREVAPMQTTIHSEPPASTRTVRWASPPFASSTKIKEKRNDN